MAVLPPPPINDAPGSFVWLEWYRELRNYISQSGSVPWSVIDFAGSDISSISVRNHNSLQNIQGGTSGQYYHLTAAQVAAIGVGNHNSLAGLQGGTTNEYYHLTSAQSVDTVTGSYGTMYINNGTVARTIAATNTYYEIPSGFTGGLTSQFTFQNAKELRCTRVGTYRISWQMSRQVPGVLQEIEGGVFKNGALLVGSTAHSQSAAASTEQSFSGNTIVSLVVNDLISLAVNNNTSTNTVTITHANCTVDKIGS